MGRRRTARFALNPARASALKVRRRRRGSWQVPAEHREGRAGRHAEGQLARYPLQDVQVTVLDGSYHEVDSSDIAFRMAGSIALKRARTGPPRPAGTGRPAQGACARLVHRRPDE